MFEVVEDKHVEIVLQLADGLVHEITPQALEPYVPKDYPREKIEEYCRTVTRPSKLPGLREFVKDTINSNSSDAVRTFIILSNLLNTRLTASLLTNSFTLISEMTVHEREQVLNAWKLSPFPIKNKLFRLFYSLTMVTFNVFAPDIHFDIIGYPKTELRDVLYETAQLGKDDLFRYHILANPKSDGNELYVPNVDALIIGSGSGAGVVAHTLSQEGFKCLVLEKGQYYHRSEYVFDDKTALRSLYENGGVLPTADGSMTVIAGATFGGGSTVNWSACLKTPFKVRKEWYDDYGIEWAANEKYDQAMDYVFEKMGVSTTSYNHSFSNKLILEGSEKLGYHYKEVGNNNGTHENHDCGRCYLGCKFGIKQGSTECWFRDAQENGCEFMTNVKVLRLLHRGGKAHGALCEDVSTGVRFTIKGPKKFIVCGGSLQTPVVLANSGFKNKHIGQNLKLHPVTVLFGDFGRESNLEPHNAPILTAVSCEVDDLDGKAHGPKIETVLHAPYLENALFPYTSSDEARKRFLKYNNLAAMLIITRDKSSGSVRNDPAKPNALIIDYAVNKYDRDALREGVLITADLLYIGGAKAIIHPQVGVDGFESDKPKEERAITDKDYVAWRAKIAKIELVPYRTSFGSAHQMSSCRIAGKGPKYGACDNNGKLYECSNVYVADASAMPTASGVNPMVSTMSIARLVALGIAKELQPQAKI